MRRYTLVHQLLRLPNLLILVLTFILAKVFRGNPQLTDWLYSGKIYPAVSRFIAGFTRKIPFSVVEYALYALIVLAALFLVVRVIALITLRKDSLMKLVSLIITFALTAAYLVFFFYALWGFNFFRTPIDSRLALPSREYSTEELLSLCEKLADDAAELRTGLEEDEDGVLKADSEALFEAIKEAYTEYGADHELFSNPVCGIKPVMASRMLSELRILGIYSGFTAEPNVNMDQPSVYLGFSAAHEVAHYYGWAREDEANFAAYIVCYTSKDPVLAYSAAMHALSNCVNDLSKRDFEAYKKLWNEHFSEGMERDLAAYSVYYKKYENSKAGDVNDKVNDSYLSFNGQEAGIAAYQQDVILLLRFYDAKGFFGRN